MGKFESKFVLPRMRSLCYWRCYQIPPRVWKGGRNSGPADKKSVATGKRIKEDRCDADILTRYVSQCDFSYANFGHVHGGNVKCVVSSTLGAVLIYVFHRRFDSPGIEMVFVKHQRQLPKRGKNKRIRETDLCIAAAANNALNLFTACRRNVHRAHAKAIYEFWLQILLWIRIKCCPFLFGLMANKFTASSDTFHRSR